MIVKEHDKRASFTQQLAEWFGVLLPYMLHGKKWDTSGPWVCEAHPMTPFEQGYDFDCSCAGPGMPPIDIRGVLSRENNEKDVNLEQ